jgi:hypothetical protein
LSRLSVKAWLEQPGDVCPVVTPNTV